jgi:NADH-quinone oxidoreductase subunit G
VSDSSPSGSPTPNPTGEHPAAAGAPAGHTGVERSEVAVRLAPKPLLTESGVGTAPPPTVPSDETVTFTLDGREITAPKGQLMIEAADAAGVYIPRFCYHPRMKPVGMCRMCLVEVKGPRGSSLMPACYNPVGDGLEISTTSEMTKKAQDGVLEFLLVNHPLDCPVCDKGGECPLQDQTLAYGPGESRFVEEKRHWEKPIPISELVNLDRERCIQCGRCVRFADEVAGDPLIDFYERGDKTEVATFADTNPFSSYFSGNIVQICPVGALTATPYRFRARPWDLGQVESSCTSCSVGCRVAVQSSGDELVRSLGVDNDPVNWSWLCDKGRFDFQAVNSEERISVPMIRKGDELVEVSWAEALATAAEGLGRARKAGAGLAVIGGARLPNEDAYAWAKLARVALHTDNVDAQLGDGLPADVVLGLPRATIDQAMAAPLVLSLAPDVKDELPVLYLRMRHAAREDGLQIVELTPTDTGLTPYAAATLRYTPGEAAALVEAIVGDGPVTAVAGVEADAIAGVRAQIERAHVEARPGSPSVVVLLGRPSLAESADGIVDAARRLAGLPGVAFLSALRRSNVHGALDLGLAPGILPGRIGLDEGRSWYEHHWSTELPTAGLDTAGILEAATRGGIGGLVLLGADPETDFPDSLLALKGLAGARFVVAVDTFLTPSSRKADVVLPAATYAERRGTFTNLEGRISHLGSIITAPGVAWPDWVIASELAWQLGTDLGFSSIEEIWAEITAVSPLHRGVDYALLTAPAGSDGVVVPVGADGHVAVRPRALDPMADPGIASAELHTVPTSAMVLRPAAAPAPVASTAGGSTNGTHAAPALSPEAVNTETDTDSDTETDADSGAGADAVETTGGAPGWPAMLQGVPPRPSPAPVAGGGLRLVATRSLWDAGTLTAHSPALSGLHPDWAARLHPDELDSLGVAVGASVRLHTHRGSLQLDTVADHRVPRGTVVVPFNLPGGSASGLIDAAAPVVTVRLEPIAKEAS